MTNHTSWRSRLQDLGGVTPAVRGDLGVAGAAALAGGRAAMEFYRNDDLSITDPTGRGPVTAADRASHDVILDLLRAERPQDAVLSEEGDPGRGDGDGRLWLVDPLDGTREFISRNGEFSIMVGLSIDGSASLGAVYRPDPGRLYLGVAERYAWRIDTETEDPLLEVVRTRPRGSGPVRIVESRSHPDPRLEEIEASIAPVERILSGSVGIKCSLIAESEADLYIHPVAKLREWDTCAPEAVLRGAGGWVSDCLGDRLIYGKREPVQPLGIFAACDQSARDSVAPIVQAIGTRLKDDR